LTGLCFFLLAGRRADVSATFLAVAINLAGTLALAMAFWPIGAAVMIDPGVQAFLIRATKAAAADPGVKVRHAWRSIRQR
jgi:hypothetical protein